jgi:hypothetical protein
MKHKRMVRQTLARQFGCCNPVPFANSHMLLFQPRIPSLLVLHDDDANFELLDFHQGSQRRLQHACATNMSSLINVRYWSLAERVKLFFDIILWPTVPCCMPAVASRAGAFNLGEAFVYDDRAAQP